MHDVITTDTETSDLDNKSQKDGNDGRNFSTDMNVVFSDDTSNKSEKKIKADSVVVTINGRKAVIKKRKRGERSKTKAGEIRDRKLDAKTKDTDLIRVQHKTGRQYRIKKRRRQEGVTWRQES